VSQQRLISWLRLWWPALVWAIIITSFSTDAFSPDHTSRIIVPLLHWLFPSASPQMLARAHHVIRKMAHVTEYFVLGLLLVRGIRGTRTGWRMEWALSAVAIAAGWAALDELHQAFVPSRGPSMRDVLIDVCGAALAQFAFAAFVALRARRGVAAGAPQ
jgi:VanZ family protein